MKIGSNKAVFLMHSILNMNVRAPGIAIHKGPIKKIYDFLIKNDFTVVQIPCPETSYVGLKRWWFTKELYDSVGYRRHCRRIAKAVSELAVKYQHMGKKYM
jgi:predicted secreted protein